MLFSVARSALSAGGLILDIAGALLLASGLMFKKPRRAVEETTPVYDFNVALDVNLALQTADAQAGALLFVAGFGAQFASALGAHESSSLDVGLACAVACAIDATVAAFLFFRLRRFHLRRMLAALLDAGGDLWRRPLRLVI